jgi:hypothetical protein
MNGSPVIINGIEVYGPPGCGIPIVVEPNGSTAAPALIPPEFAPTPPVTPSPIAPLQPHPVYPAGYPPTASGGPTETGPQMVPADWNPSFYIVRSPGAPSGDMTQNEFATNGQWGVVDWAQRADWTAAVPWSGITGIPSHLGTYWWVGEGAPADPYPGALPGDFYLDSVTGNVYQLS